ncbi:peptidoglycan editing factor PgeF [Thiohalocapsa marina]|uniref:Purine nucleoside phosphorylase n=1 Tax=Thiohalocapsa marina TaxID=424902 RepID=A0A5M8FVU0_9GAMM|nr:peptidoglycan editing factor PgeF [Thiohalocapsa marina]KAA6187948.1 peptidoglycan editing factor PgeF [Thiohalocapsa marina]
MRADQQATLVRSLIRPDWPAPPQVRAFTTTRHGGVSHGAHAGLNLADHVNDDPACVAVNRQRLRRALALPAEPVWLTQVHGCDVHCPDENGNGTDSLADIGDDAAPFASAGPRADAVVSRRPHLVCAVLTADCLPLLLCDQAGTRVGAVHAGWRGLLAGVIEAAVQRMLAIGDPRPTQLLAWLGPAIGPSAFEVGAEVREQFCDAADAASRAFRPTGQGRYLADLYTLARQRLTSMGVQRVSGGRYCTLSDPARFYSYRRDGSTGRMASLIWLDPGRSR